MRPASLIALYHAVGTPAETGYRDAVTATALERQFRWLATHYRVLPLHELLQRRRQGQSLDGLAALTFDDNHRSVLDLALPLAASFGLPSTWFLIGAPLHGKPSWRQLVRELETSGQVEAFLAFARERLPAAANLRAERFYRDSKDPARILSSDLVPLLEEFLPGRGAPADFIRAGDLSGPQPAGASIANHSDSHLVFAGLTESRQRIEIELGRSSMALTQWLTLDALALPFGEPGSYDATTLAVAAELQLRGLLLTASAPAAADDLSQHPLVAGCSVPTLVRDLPGRWSEERFQ